MAITWQKSVPNPDPSVNWPTHIWVDDGVTHEGCVLGSSYTRTVRVMSDIYSDERYCTVVDPETLRLDVVHLGGAFECNTRSGHAVPDVGPELQARLDARKAILAEEARVRAEVERLAREKADAEARLKEEARLRTEPTKGRVVTVVRGRKVPKGTTGWVFWARDGRVGLALSDKRDPVSGRVADVAWVDAAHCDALPEGNTEAEVQARLDADRKAFDDFKAAQKVAHDRKAPLSIDKVPF